MTQGNLFDLPEVERAQGYLKTSWDLDSVKANSPICWDCQHFHQDLKDLGPRKCPVSKLDVDYMGTCGAHVFRDSEVESQANENQKLNKKGVKVWTI